MLNLDPLKNINQLILVFSFLIKESFVRFDDREISISEIVIYSLLSHRILTPNEFICLTPAAVSMLSIEF